jgi:hypothetical protein
VGAVDGRVRTPGTTRGGGGGGRIAGPLAYRPVGGVGTVSTVSAPIGVTGRTRTPGSEETGGSDGGAGVGWSGGVGDGVRGFAVAQPARRTAQASRGIKPVQRACRHLRMSGSPGLRPPVSGPTVAKRAPGQGPYM